MNHRACMICAGESPLWLFIRLEFRRFESAAPLTANGSGRQKPMNGNQNNLRNIVVWIIIEFAGPGAHQLAFLPSTSQRAPSSELSYTQLVAVERRPGKIQIAHFPRR